MYTFFFFILGASVGSFLSVVIWRLHFDKKGIFFGRSKNIYTKKNLKWHELVPLLSFLLQKGKDKATKKHLPWFYFLLELTSGAFFALAWHFSPLMNLHLAFTLIIGTFWLALAGYDAKFGLVDRRITISFLLFLLFWVIFFSEREIAETLLAGGLGGLWFLLFYLLGKGKLSGEGDIDLGVCFGLSVGLSGLWPHGFLAYAFASIAGILLLIIKKTKKQSTKKIKLPMAPFLGLSVAVWLLFGQNFTSWYWQMAIGG